MFEIRFYNLVIVDLFLSGHHDIPACYFRPLSRGAVDDC